MTCMKVINGNNEEFCGKPDGHGLAGGFCEEHSEVSMTYGMFSDDLISKLEHYLKEEFLGTDKTRNEAREHIISNLHHKLAMKAGPETILQEIGSLDWNPRDEREANFGFALYYNSELSFRNPLSHHTLKSMELMMSEIKEEFHSREVNPKYYETRENSRSSR